MERRLIFKTLLITTLIIIVLNKLSAQKVGLVTGSGIVLTTSGHIATNNHVIDGATKIEVDVFKGAIKKTYKAEVIKSDAENDLAVIKISDPAFKGFGTIPYTFKMTNVNVGEKVFAMGYPQITAQGTEVKVTDGIISSKTGVLGDIRKYQTSVPIQPGNSGGPLFDAKGNLVGIIVSSLNDDLFKSQNVNYAIKATYLNNLVDQINNFPGLSEKNTLTNLPITSIIKTLSPFVVLIKVEVPVCDLIIPNEKFFKITPDMAISQVNSVIGFNGDKYRSDGNGNSISEFYRWTFCNDPLKTIECWYRDGKLFLIGKSFSNGSCSEVVNKTNYKKIQPGMTYEQVVSILGPHSDRTRSDITPNSIINFMRWYSCVNANSFIEVWFNNGKVQLCSENKLD